MRNDLQALSQKYENALRRHLTSRGEAAPSRAAALGREAASLGLETLELARMHEQALAVLVPSSTSAARRETLRKRARAFFVEATSPIERSHPAATKAKRHCRKLSETLRARTDELALSKRDARRKTSQRKTSEKTLKKKGELFEKLLKESKAVQERLRGLTRRALTSQEEERGRTSRKLQDEIAKALLGVNIRLLVMGREGAEAAKRLLKDIAMTERLIKRSKLKMRRAARDFRAPNES